LRRNTPVFPIRAATSRGPAALSGATIWAPVQASSSCSPAHIGQVPLQEKNALPFFPAKQNQPGSFTAEKRFCHLHSGETTSDQLR